MTSKNNCYLNNLLDSINLEDYEALDVVELAFNDNLDNSKVNNSKGSLLLYEVNNQRSVVQSTGILDFEYLRGAFSVNAPKDINTKKIKEVNTKIKDSSKNYSLSFNSLTNYKNSPADTISTLNEVDCLPNYVGYLDWELAEQKTPFALIYESPNSSETFGDWVSKQLKDLSEKHDEEAIKLAIDTLEQLFEALGVSLGELHNQVFKLSSFDDPESFFNSATYTKDSYQHFKKKVKSLKEINRFQIESIVEHLDISFDENLSLGVEIRCHGSLDLNKIYKTTRGLKIIDFGQTNHCLIDWNKDIDTPLNDVADVLISIKALKESSGGRMIANIDEVISGFEKSYLNAYLSFIHFPFAEPYEDLLKAKLIERAFIKSFYCFTLADTKNEDIYQSILKSLII